MKLNAWYIICKKYCTHETDCKMTAQAEHKNKTFKIVRKNTIYSIIFNLYKNRLLKCDNIWEKTYPHVFSQWFQPTEEYGVKNNIYNTYYNIQKIPRLLWTIWLKLRKTLTLSEAESDVTDGTSNCLAAATLWARLCRCRSFFSPVAYIICVALLVKHIHKRLRIGFQFNKPLNTIFWRLCIDSMLN